jgi:hypothetical protein
MLIWEIAMSKASVNRKIKRLLSLIPNADAFCGMNVIGNAKTGRRAKPCPNFSFGDESRRNGTECRTANVFPAKCGGRQGNCSLPRRRSSLRISGKSYAHRQLSLTRNRQPCACQKCCRYGFRRIYPGERLRCYGVTDFHPDNMPTLRILAGIYKLDIISKTLWLLPHCRKYLLELARLPGVNISLSFNKDIPNLEKSMAECREFIRANGLGKVVGLNYTFTTNYRKTGKSELEPIRKIEGVGVYHIVSRDKSKVAAVIGTDKFTCGVFTETGEKITDFKAGVKGSCIGCDFCRKNTLDKMDAVK